MRTITDRAGVTWTVTEAYQFSGDRNAAPDRGSLVTLAVLWFETDSGRTASAHIPAGSLDSVSDEDLLEFLRIAVARHGRQP
jgi:hypothetical protein